jgi:amidase
MEKQDGRGTAELIAAGELTSSEAVEDAIARCEELNPALNAIIHTDFERALSTAK